MRKGKLDGNAARYAELIDGQMRAELLDLEVVRTWQRNPMGYLSVPPTAIDNLMKRNFAPAESRLQSVIARLKATPAMFEALKSNIDNPPKDFTDLAIA